MVVEKGMIQADRMQQVDKSCASCIEADFETSRKPLAPAPIPVRGERGRGVRIGSY